MKNKIKITTIILLISLVSILFLKNKYKENDILTYNIYVKPSTIDPHQFRDMLSVQLMNTVYEGLLRQDENQNFIPALAKSFTENDNVLTFEIREDAKYNDGTNVTADDIVNGFRRALNPKTAARYAEMLFPIKNAEKYNKGEASKEELGVQNIDGKVIITLDKYTPYFKYILTLPISFPVKEEFTEDIADINKALYNGPYIIKKMNDDEILLEKNKYYWDNKNVEIENVKFIPLADYAVIENLIKNDELDLTKVEPKNFKGNTDLLIYPNGRLWYLEFNLSNPILNKVENRLAIMKAINREKYVKDVRLDGSTVSKSIISEILGDYKKYYPDTDFFEDNQSSNILEGKTLRLLTSNSSSEVKEANFLQEELRTKLKINVDVLTVSYKDRLALTRSGDFDIVLNTYGPKFDDPITMIYRFGRESKPSYNAWNKDKYVNLVKKIETETNHEKRNEYINQAERILVDEAVIAPLYFSVENWFIRDKYTNIIVHPISNTMDIHKIKYKK